MSGRVVGVLFLVPALSFLVVGCDRSTQSATAAVAQIPRHQVSQVNNHLAALLYAQLLTDKPGNLLFSPPGVLHGLAMTSAGARGETRAEILRVVRVPNSDAFSLAVAEFQKDVAPTEADRDTRLRFASRAWVPTDARLASDTLRAFEVQRADVVKADFVKDAVGTERAICSWVAETLGKKQVGRFPEGIVNADSELVLVSTVNFRALWKSPFPQKLTRTRDFRSADGKERPVPFMIQTGKFRHGRFGDSCVLELPYRGDEFSMLVVLPDAADGLEKLESELSPVTLNHWSERLEVQDVMVYIPKFSLQRTLNLESDLRELGIRRAFSQEADLSGLTGRASVPLSSVVHQTHLVVNEEGTEASSATALLATPLTMPAIFKADHPFLFVVRHNRSGAILFLGRFVSPVDTRPELP